MFWNGQMIFFSNETQYLIYVIFRFLDRQDHVVQIEKSFDLTTLKTQVDDLIWFSLDLMLRFMTRGTHKRYTGTELL